MRSSGPLADQGALDARRIITVHNSSCGKVMFSQTFINLFTGGGVGQGISGARSLPVLSGVGYRGY